MIPLNLLWKLWNQDPLNDKSFLSEPDPENVKMKKYGVFTEIFNLFDAELRTIFLFDAIKHGKLPGTDVIYELYKLSPSLQYRNLLRFVSYLDSINFDKPLLTFNVKKYQLIPSLMDVPSRRKGSVLSNEMKYNNVIINYYLNQLRVYRNGKEKRQIRSNPSINLYLPPITPCFIRILDWYKERSNDRRRWQVTIKDNKSLNFIDYFHDKYDNNNNIKEKLSIHDILTQIMIILHALEVSWEFYSFIHYNLHIDNIYMDNIEDVHVYTADLRYPLIYKKTWVFERPGQQKPIYIDKSFHNNQLPIIDNFFFSRLQAPFEGAERFGYSYVKRDELPTDRMGITKFVRLRYLDEIEGDQNPSHNYHDTRMLMLSFLYSTYIVTRTERMGRKFREALKENTPESHAFKRLALKMMGIVHMPINEWRSHSTSVRPYINLIADASVLLVLEEAKRKLTSKLVSGVNVDIKTSKIFDKLWTKQKNIAVTKNIYTFLNKDGVWINSDHYVGLTVTELLNDEYFQFISKKSKEMFMEVGRSPVDEVKIVAKWRKPNPFPDEPLFIIDRSKHLEFTPINCTICGEKAQYVCKTCHTVYYCGEECQREDWGDHGRKCCK